MVKQLEVEVVKQLEVEVVEQLEVEEVGQLEMVVPCTFPEHLVAGLSICPPKPEVGITGELQVHQQGHQSHADLHEK